MYSLNKVLTHVSHTRGRKNKRGKDREEKRSTKKIGKGEKGEGKRGEVDTLATARAQKNICMYSAETAQHKKITYVQSHLKQNRPDGLGFTVCFRCFAVYTHACDFLRYQSLGCLDVR